MQVSFAREGHQIGSHPEEAVPQLLRSGELLPTDHYWHDGMDTWRHISERWPGGSANHPARAVPTPPLPAPPRSDRPRARWKKLLLLLLTIPAALASFHLFRSGQAHLATPTAEEPISIVSWNLEWFPGRKLGASPEAQARHMEAAKAELSKINPDILLAQEIRDWDSFVELSKAVPDLEPAVVSAFRMGNRMATQQTAIASKLAAMAAWHESWKPSKPHPPRGFATAVLQLPDKKLLLVYSLHLRSNLARSPEDTLEIYALRNESVRQLLAHIREMEEVVFKGQITGVVVGGDFNTNHDGQFDDQVIEMLESAGFHNSWEGVPGNQRHTWVGSRQFKPTTFDYLMTKGLGTPTAELLPISEEASDHLPLRIRIPAKR